MSFIADIHKPTTFYRNVLFTTLKASAKIRFWVSRGSFALYVLNQYVNGILLFHIYASKDNNHDDDNIIQLNRVQD